MLGRLRNHSPAVLAEKIRFALQREARRWWNRRRDRRHASYPAAFPEGRLARWLPDLGPAVPPAQRPALQGMTAAYLEHRFDILGSGWQVWGYDAEPSGLEGHRYATVPRKPDVAGAWLAAEVNAPNVAEAQRLWRLLPAAYDPIDWQRDLISGYRWEPRTWYGDLAYGDHPGVDVKVPWELGSWHALPRLALAYSLAQERAPGFAEAAQYQAGFRNLVLDFLATNPPRYGVQWGVAMIPSLRIVNGLVAYDLFRAAGAVFDEAFEAAWRRSVYAHGRFILHNLEWWQGGVRNNHYLSNIVALLFTAAYLPETPETATWRAFAYRELLREVHHEFYPDGGNFEGSTGYHALSAEMVAWATALCLALPRDPLNTVPAAARRYLPRPAYLRAFGAFDEALLPKDGTAFPPSYAQRLAGMRRLVEAASKPDGLLVQIGDFDSSRLLALGPVATQAAASDAWEEDMLDLRSVADVLGVLVAPGYVPETVEGMGVNHLAGRSIVVPSGEAGAEREADALADWQGRIAAVQAPQRASWSWQAPGDSLRVGLTRQDFPDFGLYVFRSQRLYLSVRCGPAAQPVAPGHLHRDQLAVELMVDGQDVIADPGSFVYTALPEARRRYRSAAAHFAPRFADEEGAATEDEPMWTLPDWTPARCVAIGDTGLVGLLETKRGTLGRMVEILPEVVVVTDFCLDGGEPRDPGLIFEQVQQLPRTLGYGKRG